MPSKLIFNHPYFTGIDQSDLWRMCVDLKMQENIMELGWLEFERREPNCISKWMQAYAYMTNTLGQPITLDYIKKIHSICLTDVILGGNPARKIKIGEIRDGGSIAFGAAFTYNMTEKGCDQLLRLCEEKNSHLKSKKSDNPREYILLLTSNYDSTTEIENDINIAIVKCNTDIVNAIKDNKNQDKELSNKIKFIIAHFAKTIELIHPFSDGNTRVISILINKLLLENNLSPAILYNPNRLDGYTEEQFVNEIDDGQDRFKNITKIWPSTEHILRNQMEDRNQFNDDIAPLHFLAQQTLTPGWLEKGLDAVKNIDIKNKVGNTALIVAVSCGNLEGVKLLIDKGANLNIQGQYGLTALMCAEKHGHDEIAKLLIKNGARNTIQSEVVSLSLFSEKKHNKISENCEVNKNISLSSRSALFALL